MGKLSITTASVAWFKLHEFVQRREKERALIIYKLLVHSVSDQAVAKQLMGDLLHMFDDPDAFDCYQQAARFYEQAGRCEHAVALYKYMLSLDKLCDNYYVGLVRAYKLFDESRMMLAIQDYLIVLIEQKRTLDAHEYIRLSPCSSKQKVVLYEFFVEYLLSTCSSREKIGIQSHVAAAIDELHKTGVGVDQFCERLQKLDSDMYNFAKDYASCI